MFEAQEAGMRKLGLYIKSQISGGGKESYFRCFQVCNVEVRQNSLLKPTDLLFLYLYSVSAHYS